MYTCSSNATCGCSGNSAVLTKIVGGENAASQTWGWMASLRYSSTNSHFCGGSIISPLHILTAAHCTIGLSSPSAVNVYVGSIYLSDTVQTRRVSYIHIHPNYSTTTYINDISILKLSSPLTIDQTNVAIVCLPNVSSIILASQEYPAPNTSLIAIGWGYLTEGGDSVSQTLQQVTIQAIAAKSIYCKNVQPADLSVQMCAGTMPIGGKDTCQGDSGGPLLMFTSDNVWQVVGITSNGVGCARPYLPGIYTRVAAFQVWINDTMNDANHLHITIHTILISIIFIIFFVNIKD
ncbi:unnamed protein product [Adineta steineri]|uniref:Peptidase S1 domain-containing protein n=1 Tax=Adineta steineri TaxID=433720 RepID=A0A815DJ67_9BILA|nr:unnamed protein product [Adineta steineri]CAF1574448.1 unnamed protein product [Adineta steineri]